MTSYPTKRTLEDIAALKENLCNPGFVAQWLDELQLECLSGLVQYPDLATLATGHLFASPNPMYLATFKSLRSGAKSLVEIYDYVSRKLPAERWTPVDLVTLDNAWASRPATTVAVDRLKRFVAWQYRRKLATREETA